MPTHLISVLSYHGLKGVVNSLVANICVRGAVSHCGNSVQSGRGLQSRNSSSMLLQHRHVAAAASAAPAAGSAAAKTALKPLQRAPTRLYASSGKKPNSSARNSTVMPKELVLRTVPGIGKVYVERLAAQGIRSVDELAENILQQLSKADAETAFTPAVKYLQGLGIRRQDHAQRIVKHITAKFDGDLHSRLQEFEGAGQGGVVSITPTPLTLCVEGNISAGKSTFLQYITNNNEDLQRQLGVVHEPVEEWQRVPSGNGTLNLLDEFYKDPEKYAYTFQNYVFMSRVMQERNSQNISQPVRLIERSVFSDRMVFVRAVKESGWMGDVELAVYDSWFGPILDSNPSLVPDGFIYLQCQPTTCMQRLKMRARSEEKNSVSMEYLEGLHLKHEDWLGKGAAANKLSARPSDQRQSIIRAHNGLVLPVEPSARLQDSLFYLDKNEAAQEMHKCLDAVPALVLDCNRDVLRDLDLQREVQQTVAEYIAFMRNRREFLLEEKRSTKQEGSSSSISRRNGSARSHGRSASTRVHSPQPGGPDGVQQEATELVQAAARSEATSVVPNSSGQLQAHAVISGNLEALQFVADGNGNGRRAAATSAG